MEPAATSATSDSHPQDGNTTQIPAPESAKEKLRARPHIPWMRLGKDAGDNSVNKTPVGSQGLSPAESARMRFATRGNAVLTGGAGGLALHCSRALLEHGVSGLALLDLPASFHDEDAQRAISQLRADFPDAQILTEGADVTDSASVRRAVQHMRSSLGPLRILCCFAGVVSATAAQDTPPEEWRKVLDVNTTGTWFATQAVADHMISDSVGGRIVLISSISGHRVNYPQPQVAYNTSKAAILHMRASLAAEWARYGIRVNSISPGYMDTVLNEGDALEAFREVWASRNPVGRMGVPEELTGPLVMLCSDVGGSYVNGADIVVDGGGCVF